MELDESKLLDVNGIVQCKRIIIPDECFFMEGEEKYRYFTAEYKQLVQKIRLFGQMHFTPDSAYEKLYFSYKSYGNFKGNASEEKLEDFFHKQGYKIIYPENYTFDEQLNMLANCHYFASTIGSCSHNMIFLPEQAKVVLIPRGSYLTMYQTAFDQVIDLDIYYIDASLSVLADRSRPQFGPFFYYISKNLLNFFEIDEPCDKKYWKEQFADLKKYMNAAKTYDNLGDRYMPEYYAKQFAYCMEHISNLHPFRQRFWRMRLQGVGVIPKYMKAYIAAFVIKCFPWIVPWIKKIVQSGRKK